MSMKHRNIIFLLSCIFFEHLQVVAKTNNVERNLATTGDSLMKPNFAEFNKRKIAWEKKLTPEQKSSMADLLSTYHDEFEQYQKSPKDKNQQEIMRKMKSVFENLMQNWNSFYKQHVAIENFHDQSEQKGKSSQLIEEYTSSYHDYDKNPTSVHQKAVLKAQKKLQKSM
jgi:hypothetical protein